MSEMQASLKKTILLIRDELSMAIESEDLDRLGSVCAELANALAAYESVLRRGFKPFKPFKPYTPCTPEL